MNISKLILIGFSILVLIFAAIIYNLYKKDRQAFYKISIKETVKEIYTVRGRPLQRNARLNNDMLIDVPEEFIPYIHPGDSIMKESNSGQIILITFHQNSRTIITHP